MATAGRFTVGRCYSVRTRPEHETIWALTSLWYEGRDEQGRHRFNDHSGFGETDGVYLYSDDELASLEVVGEIVGFESTPSEQRREALKASKDPQRRTEWQELCRPWKPGDWVGPRDKSAQYMVQAIKGEWVTLRSFNGAHTYRRKMRGMPGSPPYTKVGDEPLQRVDPPAPPASPFPPMRDGSAPPYQPVQKEPRKIRANFGTEKK